MPGRFEFKEQAYFNGVPFDVIGVSYYSYWHGSLDTLQYNLNDITARYDKDVIVVETAYPFTLEDKDGWPNIIGSESQLTPGYPAMLRAVPNGRGLGIFYWDATWTGVPGNGWENQALFDFNDEPLPAFNEVRP